MTTFEKSNAWLDELAKTEIAMEQTGKMDAFSHLSEEKILKDHTVSFLNELRTLFQTYASHFNQARRNSRQTIKIYGISNTEADFLVFRNSLKLVVTYGNPGQIDISFHTLTGGLYAPLKRQTPKAKGKIPGPPGNLEAEVGDVIAIELGPFNEAYWTFQNLRVTPAALARYYLTEFIKNSV